MINSLTTILMLLASAHAWAAPQNILHCLGLEEEHYHLNKITGPELLLNQALIEQFSR